MSGPIRTTFLGLTALEGVDIYVQLKRPVFLVTPADGTHEVTRVYVKGGRGTFGPYGDSRIGPETVCAVHWDARTGLQITTRGGYLLVVPAEDVAGSIKTH